MNILIFISLIAVAFCISGAFFETRKKYDFLNREYTTIAKGIAIVMIMVCHCSGLWPAGRVLSPWGGIGVSMFLITSGFGLNESYKRSGLKDFWKKRLGRVYLPYFVALLGYAFVFNWEWQKCMWNFSCIHSPYWFVSYIIMCYILFYLSSRFFYKYRIVILFIISFLSLIFMPELQAEQSFAFFIGVLFSDNKEELVAFRHNDKKFLTLCIGLIVVGTIFLALKQLPVVRYEANEIEMNIIQCMIKLPLALFILFAIDYSKKILMNPLFSLAGVISYELYLVHFPFYTFIGNRLWPAIVLIVLSFVVSYCFYKMNNKIHQRIISL